MLNGKDFEHMKNTFKEALSCFEESLSSDLQVPSNDHGLVKDTMSADISNLLESLCTLKNEILWKTLSGKLKLSSLVRT